MFVRTAFVVSVLLLSACQPQPSKQYARYNGSSMGTYYQVTVVAQTDQDLSALAQQIEDELQAVDQSMSTYTQDSQVSQFNRSTANQPFALSEPLRQVIAEALLISQQSEGAFDITVGAAVRIWGFGADHSISGKPTAEQLLTLRESSSYTQLQLNANRLSKLHSDTTIDLSAIAKGFAIDQVARMLTQQGISNYLVEVGGELRASGRNGDNHVWRVAIEKPELLGGVQQVIELDNTAIATSGDYRNFVTIDGEHYAHTIDPRTLAPARNRLASVSVLSTNASTADALATAMMVMGEEQAYAFAVKNKLAAFFIVRGVEPNTLNLQVTDQFRATFLPQSG